MPNASQQPVAPSGHILLITRDYSDQTEIMALLQQVGYEVDRIDNSTAVLQALSHGCYDLLLLITHPQEPDVTQLAEQIRRLPAPLGLTPIIAMIHKQALTNRYLTAGINAVLILPLQQEQLLSQLKYWLPPTETTRSAGDELLNLDILEELEANTRRELLQRVVNIFIEETENKLQCIIAACQDGDWHSLHYAAHTLKSSAGTLGAQGLYSHVQELDKACQSGDLDKVRFLVSSIGRVAIPTLNALTRRYLDRVST